VLLSAASRRQDGAIVLTANLKGSAAGKVIVQRLVRAAGSSSQPDAGELFD
jgi:hypothetical protein